MKIITFLFLCLLTQGCVGIAVQKSRTRTFQDLEVESKAAAFGLHSRDASHTNATTYTVAWLDAHWGTPSSITHNSEGGRDEVRIYKFGPIWRGVVPFVLIPIPLLLPTDRERVLFILRDGCIISGERRESQSVGGAFGCYPVPCGFHFGTFSMSD